MRIFHRVPRDVCDEWKFLYVCGGWWWIIEWMYGCRDRGNYCGVEGITFNTFKCF